MQEMRSSLKLFGTVETTVRNRKTGKLKIFERKNTIANQVSIMAIRALTSTDVFPGLRSTNLGDQTIIGPVGNYYTLLARSDGDYGAILHVKDNPANDNPVDIDVNGYDGGIHMVFDTEQYAGGSTTDKYIQFRSVWNPSAAYANSGYLVLAADVNYLSGNNSGVKGLVAYAAQSFTVDDLDTVEIKWRIDA
jgi:hypothetical protein